MTDWHCCAVLGHSPMRFVWGFDEEDLGCRGLKLELLQQVMTLRLFGVSRFMVACDHGVGLWVAEMVNFLRERDIGLQLFCVLPHEEQATKWAPYLRERYFKMLEHCSQMAAVSSPHAQGAQLYAYEAMIDCADIVLAVYDPSSDRGDAVDRAMAYAQEKHREIIAIHPDTLAVTASTLYADIDLADP